MKQININCRMHFSIVGNGPNVTLDDNMLRKYGANKPKAVNSLRRS